MQDDEPRPDPGAASVPREPTIGAVRIQTITCGRCGWPNACRVQAGLRLLRFTCDWCHQMTTGIVDPLMKRYVIF